MDTADCTDKLCYFVSVKCESTVKMLELADSNGPRPGACKNSWDYCVGARTDRPVAVFFLKLIICNWYFKVFCFFFHCKFSGWIFLTWNNSPLHFCVRLNCSLRLLMCDKFMLSYSHYFTKRQHCSLSDWWSSPWSLRRQVQHWPWLTQVRRVLKRRVIIRDKDISLTLPHLLRLVLVTPLCGYFCCMLRAIRCN